MSRFKLTSDPCEPLLCMTSKSAWVSLMVTLNSLKGIIQNSLNGLTESERYGMYTTSVGRISPVNKTSAKARNLQWNYVTNPTLNQMLHIIASVWTCDIWFLSHVRISTQMRLHLYTTLGSTAGRNQVYRAPLQHCFPLIAYRRSQSETDSAVCQRNGVPLEVLTPTLFVPVRIRCVVIRHVNDGPKSWFPKVINQKIIHLEFTTHQQSVPGGISATNPIRWKKYLCTWTIDEAQEPKRIT